MNGSVLRRGLDIGPDRVPHDRPSYRAECHTRPGTFVRYRGNSRRLTIAPGTVDSRLTLLIIEPLSITLLIERADWLTDWLHACNE